MVLTRQISVANAANPPSFCVWRSAQGGSCRQLNIEPVEAETCDGLSITHLFTDSAVGRGILYLYGLEEIKGASYGLWELLIPKNVSRLAQYLPLVRR